MANTLAYGFVGLQSLFNTRAAEAGVERIFTAVQESAREHSRQIAALMSSFVEPTEVAQEQFELPAGGELQDLDEWGNPKPVQVTGSYQVGYPIKGAGTAWGTNRITAALMTVAEANRFTTDAQSKDAVWLRRHLLAAVLSKTSWTFNDKVGPNGTKGLGDITIQPLANGDTVTYVRRDGSVSTDNHYIAQAAAVADATNPFPVIYTELMEHPSNAGPVVCYIPSNIKTDVTTLANFVAVTDPDIRVGADNDELVGSLGRGFGDEVLGKVDQCWIVEWSALPSDYIIAHAQGAGPVLKMREYPAPELKGLFSESHSPDGNRMETRMLRYCGFGVANRVAAVAYFVEAGDTTYDTPSGYAPPL